MSELDILYVIGSKPLPGILIGNRRFWEIHRRLSKYFKIGILEPHYGSTLEVLEIDDITVYRIPYVGRFLYSGPDYLRHFNFRISTAISFPFFIKNISKNVKIVHESMSPIPFFSKLYTKKYTILTVHEIQGIKRLLIYPYAGFIPYITEEMLIHYNKFYDQIITVGTGTQKKLEKKGIPSVLIHNGVDTEKFKPNSNIINDKVTILTVGRMTRQKGHLLFLSMIQEIIDDYRNIEFIILGRGPLLNKILAKISEYKLNRYVKIISRYLPDDDYLNLLLSCDIYAHPNFFQEGFGFSIAESMSCGKPVVAFNIPGVGEWVRNGIDGYLVTDVPEFIAKLQLLIDDKRLRHKLGYNARNNILENFSIEQSIIKTKMMYQKIFDYL